MNNNLDVYLAGPIAGLTYAGCTDWRDYVRLKLSLSGIRALSPLRGKEGLKSLSMISGSGEEYAHRGPLYTARGIMTRDRFDATRCAVLFVNLLGAEQVSIGTCMEIAWADACRTPIVCVIEKEGNPHEHIMIDQAIGFRVETLDAGIAVTREVLV
jgi:hypothetical protein